ncbi:MAG: hypothetical protein ACK424_06795 [Candidatus Thermochlorobacter sp.]
MPKVLIIDDSAVERTIIAKVMTALGYTIVEANDGEEGEAKAVEIKPDIIIASGVVIPFSSLNTLLNFSSIFLSSSI